MNRRRDDDMNDEEVFIPEVLPDDYGEDDDGGALMRQANDMIATNQQGLAHELTGALINSIDLAPQGFLQRMEARGQLRYYKDVADAARTIATNLRVAQNELNNTAKDIVDTFDYVYSRYRKFDIDRARHPYDRVLAIGEAKEKILLTQMRMTGHRTIAAQRSAMRHVAQRAAAKEAPERQPMTKEQQVARQAVIRGKNGTGASGAGDLYTAFAGLTYMRHLEDCGDPDAATEKSYEEVLFMVETKGISEADARSYAAQFEQEKKHQNAKKMSNAQASTFGAQFKDTRGKK
jgi:hypothetical protein